MNPPEERSPETEDTNLRGDSADRTQGEDVVGVKAADGSQFVVDKETFADPAFSNMLLERMRAKDSALENAAGIGGENAPQTAESLESQEKFALVLTGEEENAAIDVVAEHAAAATGKSVETIKQEIDQGSFSIAGYIEHHPKVRRAMQIALAATGLFAAAPAAAGGNFGREVANIFGEVVGQTVQGEIQGVVNERAAQRARATSEVGYAANQEIASRGQDLNNIYAAEQARINAELQRDLAGSRSPQEKQAAINKHTNAMNGLSRWLQEESYALSIRNSETSRRAGVAIGSRHRIDSTINNAESRVGQAVGRTINRLFY